MTNYIPDAAGWLLDEYDADRFWAKVEFRGGMPFLEDPLSRLDASAGECWTWNGDERNYGTFIHYGTRHGAHVISLRDFGGKIPEGYDVDHLCRNPPCVNPAHLEAVTRSVNIRRGLKVAKTHCRHGHAMTGENVLLSRRKGVESRSCAACKQKRAREEYDRKLAAQGKTRVYRSKNNN